MYDHGHDPHAIDLSDIRLQVNCICATHCHIFTIIDFRITMTALLSTEAFFKRLHQIDIDRSDILFTEEVNFKPGLFVSMMKRSDKFEVIEAREGLFSEVRHGTDRANVSKQTGPLDWHADGLYRSTAKLPQFLLLHCADPGEGRWRTDFTDAARAFDRVFSPKAAEEWLSVDPKWLVESNCFNKS
jgi:hypothetical protein